MSRQQASGAANSGLCLPHRCSDSEIPYFLIDKVRKLLQSHPSEWCLAACQLLRSLGHSLCFYVRESRPLLRHGITKKQNQLARFNISYCIHKIYRSSGREAIMSVMRVKLSIGIRASRLQCVWTKNTDLAISPSKLFYKSWVLYLNEPSWWSSLEKQLSPNCFEQTPKQSPGSKFFHFAPRTAVILAVEIRRKWPLSDSICSHIPAPHTLLA